MKGDFTRETFKSAKHYWGVLRQQGRVDLDADWNEQIRIGRYHFMRRTADLIGPAGGPAEDAGFEIGVEDGPVSIRRGRYYVSGILCENDADVDLTGQGDNPGEPLPTTAGLHLAYLDVWDRHVTALDDPQIRETALGGPDTANRARTVWQVKTTHLADSTPELDAAVAALAAARSAEDPVAEAAALQQIRELAHSAYCDAPLDPLGGSLESGTGTLAARAGDMTDAAGDPCRFEPGGRYRRLENRLYRVEIHDPDSKNFKWSRDNGSVVLSIEEFLVDNPGDTQTQRVRVRRLGVDEVQALKRDDWVEIVGDDEELTGVPGKMARVTNQPDPSDRILELSEVVNVRDPELHPKVRRWDMRVDVGLVKIKQVWTPLEDGVEVKFGSGTFHTGDYWLIPARTNTADVEWPPHPSYPGEDVTGDPEQLPPMGIERHRAPLAVLVHDGTALVAAVDLRRMFPAATDQAALFYAGGDGQEPELPAGVLPQPLQVAVAAGNRPVSGVLVEFTVISGSGELDAGAGFGAGPLTVPTNDEGLASVHWRVNISPENQRVRARLLDRCNDPTHVPVYFNTQVNYQLHYLSGDGQEGIPGERLEPLRVWVSDGRWPVEGAKVEFVVTQGTGTLSTVAPTNPDGIAECEWTLDTVNHRQQVEARLLDGAGDPVHEAAIRFNANLSVASQVAYNPEKCSNLSGVTSVQDAIDILCQIKPGGGCCVTVGEGGEFERLEEALKALLKQEQWDVCLCLLPGDHKLADLEVAFRIDEPEIHLKIVGCGLGSRVFLEEPIGFTGLKAFTLHDVTLELRFPADDKKPAIAFDRCQEVSITACHIAGFTRSDGEEPLGALLSITNADRVWLKDNVLEAALLGSLELIKEVFDKAGVNSLAELFHLPGQGVLDSETFKMLAMKSVKELVGLSLQDRKKVKTALTAVVNEFAKNNRLSSGEIFYFQEMISEVGIKKPALEDLYDNVLDIRRAAIKSRPGVALILGPTLPALRIGPPPEIEIDVELIAKDEDDYATLESNQIIGILSLYGMPAPADVIAKIFDKTLLDKLEGHLKEGQIVLRGRLGTMQIRGNQLVQISVARDMIDQFRGLVEFGSGELDNLFGRCLLSDNVIEGAISLLATQHLAMSASEFTIMALPIGFSSAVGIVIADSSIYMGNHCKQPQVVLLDASRASSQAANLEINIG